MANVALLIAKVESVLLARETSPNAFVIMRRTVFLKVTFQTASAHWNAGIRHNVPKERMARSFAVATTRKTTFLTVVQTPLLVTRHARLVVSSKALGSYALVFANLEVFRQNVQTCANQTIVKRINSVWLSMERRHAFAVILSSSYLTVNHQDVIPKNAKASVKTTSVFVLMGVHHLIAVMIPNVQRDVVTRNYVK